MSAKTKIVVLRMKELIYTGIFVALGILLVIFLITLLSSGRENGSLAEDSRKPDTKEASSDQAAVSGESIYIPGVYTTQLVLNDHTLDIKVTVDQYCITSVSLENLDDATTSMYPLLQPAFENIRSQILEKQSLGEITYDTENKYTSLVLLESVKSALEKASPSAG